MNPKRIFDNLIPGGLVDPQQTLELVVVEVENVVDLVENASDVADQNDQDEQTVENVVYDVESAAYYEFLEAVVENLYFIELSQIYQLN